MEWIKKRKKTGDDEEAKLNDALLEFQAEFGQNSSAAKPKTFLRGNVVEGNKSFQPSASGSVYAPKMSFSIASKTSNVGSKDFDEAKKLAAAKAKRMLEDAARSRNAAISTKVIAPTTQLTQRPPKPGSKMKTEKPKMSQLEMFKQELQRVQEDREKRKDLRNHLEKSGMDSAVVDKIAPQIERPFHGNGEFDDDPYTTNVYVSNIPHNVTEEDLLFTFGSFGPLAALKILYPRSEEERRRPHICAFVAFMSRHDVDRFLSEVRVVIIRNEPIRFSFARPVTIPQTPYYIPPQLLALQCPDVVSGLPFNAQPIREEAEKFLEKYKSFPPLNLLPTPGHPAYEDFQNLIKNSTIRVVIPPDRPTLRLINRTAIYVVTEGAHFEAMLCANEFQNPLFMFLWDNSSACHVYYRWRIYSLLQGDTLTNWRRDKFRMFVNGSWWIPPFSTAELNRAMPECLYNTTCLQTYPERWMNLQGKAAKNVQPAAKPQRAIVMDRARRAAEVQEKLGKREVRRTMLSMRKRDKLEKIIREMTPEQNVVADVMVWCLENASCAKEISECIYESLTIEQAQLHKKIARLYLINDILANCGHRSVKDVFLYRGYFEALLEKIFVAVGKTYKSISSRIKQEQFKQRVMNIFRHWEDTALYTTDKLIQAQNIFLGLIEVKEEEDEEEDENEKRYRHRDVDEDEDLDGVPIGMKPEIDDDEDIDGVPMEFDDDEKDNEPHKPKYETMFKPVVDKSINEPSPMFTSKWDDVSNYKKFEADDDDIQILDTENSKNATRASMSPGEIRDETPKRASSSASKISSDIEERRRKLKRDVEVRAMTMLDDLEADRDPDVKKKVDEFRRTEMEKVDQILKDEEKSKGKKERDREHRSSKKERKRSRSRSRTRDRSREKNRDRDRDRDRKRHRDSKSSDRRHR